MAHYTQLDQNDGEKIAKLYGLKFISLKSIEAGSENSNYFMQAKEGQFVLTLIEVKALKAVEKIVRLHEHLESQHYPAPLILTPLGEKSVAEYGGKPILMKKHIAGAHLEHPTKDQLQSLGAHLARLNVLPGPSYLARRPNFGMEWMATLLQEDIEASFAKWLENTLNNFDAQAWEALPKGLIHADLFLDNVLFRDGQVAAILDFEEACQYMLLFDLGMAIVGCCQEAGQISVSQAKHFIAGYQSVRPLNKNEQEALPNFIRYGAASTACWRYWKFNLLKAAPGKRERYKAMIAIAERPILEAELF